MNTRHGERINQVNEKLKEKRIEVNELQLEDKIHGVLQKHASDQNSSTDIAALEDKIVHTVGQRLGAEMSRVSNGDKRRIRLPPNTVTGSGPAEASREAFKDDRYKEYWTARRSLRVWSVQGDVLYEAAAAFLRHRLQIDRRLVPPREEMRVRVAEVIGRSKGKNEVVILF